MRAVLLVLLLLGPGLLRAEAVEPEVRAVPEVRVEAPRDYGWWIGDRLVHRALVVLPGDATVVPGSLPRPRPVAYWLDLVATSVKDTRAEGRRAVLITTEWQTFYAALEPVRREVPPYRLHLSDGSEVEIPGWGFVTSPIRPILIPSAPGDMQPDAGVRPARAGALLRATAGFGILALLSAGALAAHQSWWPFRPGPARPFTAAARAARRAPDAAGAALALHRGFDTANDRPLVAADVGAFVAGRPEFLPLAGEISAFFDRSAQRFFGADSGAPEDAGITLGLARRLAALERGRA